jgi:hypothetical protein
MTKALRRRMNRESVEFSVDRKCHPTRVHVHINRVVKPQFVNPFNLSNSKSRVGP